MHKKIQAINKFQNRKKMRPMILVVALLVLMLGYTSSPITVSALDPQKYASGLNILVYHDSNDFTHDEYTGLDANYTAAGNTINVVNSLTWDFKIDDLSNYDILFISVTGYTSILDNVANPEVGAIKTWFDSGNKTLWVGGDSDFGGFWIANASNPLLEAIGTPLRFDAGAIEDPESNDEAPYRVIANETGVGSPLVDYVTTGFTQMPFHAPTSVNYWDGSNYTDLRNASLPFTIDIVINSSSAATTFDQDFSQGDDDFYAYSGITGNYPFLVIDRNASTSNSMLVLSGEQVFSDYKNMYGNTVERTFDLHSGAKVVDNVLTYYFVELLGYDFINLIRLVQTTTNTATETQISSTTITETISETQTTFIFSDTLTVTDTIEYTEILTETVTLTVAQEVHITETTTETVNVTTNVPTDEANVPLPDLSFFVITVLLFGGVKSFRKRISD